MEAFELNAEERTGTGTAESRRLRKQGRVPAIIYGGKGEPVMVTFEHNEFGHHLANEAFFSHIIKIKVKGGKTEEAVLRALQRHPARAFIEHADFLRVVADEKLRMSVPVHLVGAEDCPGVKEEDGIVQHIFTEVEIECLPRDLPEYVEVDVSKLHLNEAVHLSQLPLPDGVDLVVLLNAEEDDESADSVVVSVQLPRVVAEDSDEDEDAVEGEGAADESADEDKSAEDASGEGKE